MAEPTETAPARAARAPPSRARPGWAGCGWPISRLLVTYFCYGARRGHRDRAALFPEGRARHHPRRGGPGIAFWVALPWSTKMVGGGSRPTCIRSSGRPARFAYLLLGRAAHAGWATRGSPPPPPPRAAYLAALVISAVGLHGPGRGGRRPEPWRWPAPRRRSSRSRPWAAWRCWPAPSAWANLSGWLAGAGRGRRTVVRDSR